MITKNVVMVHLKNVKNGQHLYANNKLWHFSRCTKSNVNGFYVTVSNAQNKPLSRSAIFPAGVPETISVIKLETIIKNKDWNIVKITKVNNKY